MAGGFAVDGEGVVRCGGPVERRDSIPDFEEGVRALEAERASL